MAVKDEKRLDPAVFALLLLSAVMLAVRLFASRTVGFGDSEALYACYALHPQAAYLDHPGLVGLFASSLGGGVLPSAQAAHMVTAVLASMLPWMVMIVAQRLGAQPRRAAIAGLVVACTPEIGIGLFAMTPDLLLAYLWLAFIGLCAMALESEPKSGRAAALFSIAGLVGGVAASAKITGLFLLPALVVTAYADGRHRRTAWPWVGTLAGLLPIAAIAQFEAAHAYPMLRHRFIDTQHGAGASLRNLGSLVGGQLLYVSPIIVVIVILVARRLVRDRKSDVVTQLLFWTFALPILPLVVLCVWSRVAEPHWLAPPLLALPIFAARSDIELSRRLVGSAMATGLGLVLAVHVWILSPSLLRFAPASYDPKVDIANELFGWPQASRSAGGLVDDAEAGQGMKLDAWLVGPSWMVCAQLQANAPQAQVGCATSTPTDFDDWAPRSRWSKADAIVFVTDDRMPVDVASVVPSFHTERTERVSVLRGGRIVRTFRLTLLMKRVGA